MRGLKRLIYQLIDSSVLVAPLAGAWIETDTGQKLVDKYKSHLSQVRGLKPDYLMVFRKDGESHLSQVRGLKHRSAHINGIHLPSHLSQVCGLKPCVGKWLIDEPTVAPLVGAWIETWPAMPQPSALARRTSRRCVD